MTTPDTPETVQGKLAALPVIMALWVHYIVENHPGDYADCECSREGES